MQPKKQPLGYRQLMALSEEERYEHGVYHRWDNDANLRKLDQLYGLVAAREDAEIMAAIRGRRVLDVGAGYGFFARRLLDHGFEVTAVDPNQALIEIGRARFGVEIHCADVHDLPFPARRFDTVIFREAVEHLDCERAFQEADRVATQAIVIFQSHLNPVLELCRRLSGHEELRPERLEYYQDLLRRLGYTCQTLQFRDVFALPLSGGTLTPQMVPRVRVVERAVVALDDAVNRALQLVGLQRLLCWRFLLRAEKPGGNT